MKKLEYRVEFTTPAFLGNAGQSGQWRTPPFKAQLRQWWRVAFAAGHGFKVDIETMRRVEGRLFGHAWLGDDREENGSKVAARKSLVRIRLDSWTPGDLKTVPDIGSVNIGRNSLPAALYGGYGPIDKGPRLKAGAAMQAGDAATLRIAFPEGEMIDIALALMNRYGTVGGRSRNGWGSYTLTGELPDLQPPLVDWQTALQRDWPHAIGVDAQGPLVWETSVQDRWEKALRLLVQARADMRRAVPERLLLAYPDTQGALSGWGRNERVPNSLRFKVLRNNDQFIGTVFHIPCRPSEVLWGKLPADKQRTLAGNFAAAHQFLDKQFSRAGA